MLACQVGSTAARQIPPTCVAPFRGPTSHLHSTGSLDALARARRALDPAGRPEAKARPSRGKRRRRSKRCAPPRGMRALPSLGRHKTATSVRRPKVPEDRAGRSELCEKSRRAAGRIRAAGSGAPPTNGLSFELARQPSKSQLSPQGATAVARDEAQAILCHLADRRQKFMLGVEHRRFEPRRANDSEDAPDREPERGPLGRDRSAQSHGRSGSG